MMFNEFPEEMFKFLMIAGGGSDPVEPLPFRPPKYFQQFATTGCNCKGSTISIFAFATKHTAVPDAEDDAEFTCRSPFYS